MDGGLTWTPFAKTPSKPVSALAVHPTDSRILYEGFVGDGVYKTSDDGATWQEANHGLAGLVPNGLAVVPGNPGTVYATVGGIFKTDNGGKSWLRLACDDCARSPVIDPVTPTRVYATVGNAGGVDISEDGGSHWRRVNTPVPSQYADRYHIEGSLLVANPKQPGHLVLGVSFIDKRVVQWDWIAGGFYTSTDYGETWSFVDMGQEISPVLALAFDPFTSTVVYAGTGNKGIGTGIWKSTDGGATWFLAGLPGQEVPGIAVDHRDLQTVYVTAGGKFYVSHDAGQGWTQIADEVYSNLLYIPTDPPVLYVYGAMGMKRSMDAGQHWETPAGVLAHSTIGSMAVVTTTDRVIVYVGTSGGTVSGGAEQLQSQASGETLVNAGVYRYTSRLLNTPQSVAISGPTTGIINTAYIFTATVSSVSATVPFYYTWQATGQAPVTHTSGLGDTATFTWDMPGTQVITVTASNGATVTDTHIVVINAPLTSVDIGGPTEGFVNAAYAFTATASPIVATLPITYIWQATGLALVTHTGGLSDTFSFTWSAPGLKVITVTADNGIGAQVADVHAITVEQYHIYLPVILRNG